MFNGDPGANTVTSYAWIIWRKADRSKRCLFFWIPDGARLRHSRADDAQRFAANSHSG
jgi:hypothetical protein